MLFRADDCGIPDPTHQNDDKVAYDERGPLVTTVHSRVDHPGIGLVHHATYDVPRLEQRHSQRMVRARRDDAVRHRIDTGKLTQGVETPGLGCEFGLFLVQLTSPSTRTGAAH